MFLYISYDSFFRKVPIFIFPLITFTHPAMNKGRLISTSMETVNNIYKNGNPY
ncbi:hypothetical protein KIS1582_2536 [Cytobacillus firmus]|uniref:Uncharacterized protein n=1 Tax=Cytobacillus firmus TaxID=1399 RepID=A0A800NAA6_CYTFI|nr:hypothetical protein KIS1582_2536 [Cytobacillus firmus]